MKKIKNLQMLFTAILLLACFTVFAQKETSVTTTSQTKNEKVMKTYLIERNIPNAGAFTAEELKGISQKSCSVLKDMGPSIQWLQSYVTGDKIFCVYKAENEQLIREHGAKGGFPVTKITEIENIISPATAGN